MFMILTLSNTSGYALESTPSFHSKLPFLQRQLLLTVFVYLFRSVIYLILPSFISPSLPPFFFCTTLLFSRNNISWRGFPNVKDVPHPPLLVNMFIPLFKGTIIYLSKIDGYLIASRLSWLVLQWLSFY